MDVLEQIEDDAAFIDILLEKIPCGSMILVTVPAFQFLFSSHDVFLKHHRRYNKKELLRLLNHAALHIGKCHYFYASLFVMRAAASFIQRKQLSGIGSWRFSEKSLVTRLFYAVLNFDF
jgi:hypothetical protein